MLEVVAKKGAFRSIRFIQLLSGWANGDTYEKIAEQQNLSKETMIEYGKILREDLGVKDKSEAISKAVARGMIVIRESNISKLIVVGLIVTQITAIDWHPHARTSKLSRRANIERRIDEA